MGAHCAIAISQMTSAFPGFVSAACAYRARVVLDKRARVTPRAGVVLIGETYCKLDAGYTLIDVGDLLTTPTTPGHAMKTSDVRALAAPCAKR